jgi:alkylation response protein AidB-like acyl-CoA dehydrogenase
MTTSTMANMRQRVSIPPQTIDWVARAKSLLPVITADAAEIDATQRLTDNVLAALIETGMFRLLAPWELGGHQVDPPTFVAVIEAIARADASTAWVVSQCSVCSMAAAYLPPPAGALIVGNDPKAVLAWGALPSGKAVREGEGWRIGGKWFFASGSRHATWMGGRCPLFEADGTPILDDKGNAVVRMFMFPKSDVITNESWDVIGLRGTGSDSYSVTDLFVPDDRQFDVNVQANHPGLLYRIVNRHLFGPGVGGVALGVSRSVLDSFKAAAADEKKGMKTSSAIQSELGWAEARWRSVRAFLYEALREMWEDIKAGKPESVEHQINVRCASTLAIHECKKIVDFAFHEAGASAILNSLPFERRVRDMHAVLQHGQSKRSNMEAVGRHALGMDPGPLIL